MPTELKVNCKVNLPSAYNMVSLVEAGPLSHTALLSLLYRQHGAMLDLQYITHTLNSASPSAPCRPYHSEMYWFFFIRSGIPSSNLRSIDAPKVPINSQPTASPSISHWTLYIQLDPLYPTGPSISNWTLYIQLDLPYPTGPSISHWTLYIPLDPLYPTGPSISHWTLYIPLEPLYPTGPSISH